MRGTGWFILLLTVVISVDNSSANILNEILDTFNLNSKEMKLFCNITDGAFKAFGDITAGYKAVKDIIALFQKTKPSLLERTYLKIEKLDRQIETVYRHLQAKLNKLDRAVEQAERLNLLYGRKREAASAISIVMMHYSSFVWLNQPNRTYPNFIKQDFTNAVLNTAPGTPYRALNQLYTRVTEPTATGNTFLSLQAEYSLNDKRFGDQRTSLQTYFIKFFAMLILLEHMGISLIIYATSLKAEEIIHTKDSSTRDLIPAMLAEAYQRMRVYSHKFQEGIQSANPWPEDIYRSDALQPNRGRSFTELDGYSQIVITMYLPKYPSTFCAHAGWNCDRDNCDVLTSYAKVRRCTGSISSCKTVGRSVRTCSTPSSYNASSARYLFYIDDDNKQFGSTNVCPPGYFDTVTGLGSLCRAQHWWVPRDKECLFCQCNCEGFTSIYFHAIDTTSKESNIQENKVITGIRIRRSENIVFLQIKQGKLLPYGEIDAADDDTEWYPSEDKYKHSHPDFGHIASSLHKLTEGQDKMVLDQSYLRSQHVVTKVAFRVNSAKQVYLWYEGTEYSAETGLLNAKNTNSPKLDTVHTEEVTLKDTISPLKATDTMNFYEYHNKYVRFQHTSPEKEAGQTTVPFFDMLSLEAIPHTPFSGLGLKYKGIPEDFVAGYITLFGELESKQPWMDKFQELLNTTEPPTALTVSMIVGNT